MTAADDWTDALPIAAPLQVGLVVIQAAPLRTPCVFCCHWSLPLALHAIDTGRALVAMRYAQWIVWHLHVILHQGVTRTA